MLEELKVVMSLLESAVGDVTSAAMWVALGFFVFKTATCGGILYTIVFLGNVVSRRLFLWLEKRTAAAARGRPTVLSITGAYASKACINGLEQRFLLLMEGVSSKTPGLFSSDYLHDQHIRWLETAVENQRLADAKAHASKESEK